MVKRLWVKIDKRRWMGITLVAVLFATMALAFPVHITHDSNVVFLDGNVAVITLRQGEWQLVIGNPVNAQEADYTCDGVDDHVQFQAALDALPSVGGQLLVLAGDYVWGNTETVTRAIDDVSVIGVGTAVYILGDGVTSLFSAGGNNWLFSNFETDAGGINMGATTDWMWLNLAISTTYYSLRTDSINVEDHSSLHESGGADEIKLDDLGTPDDNTDLDASLTEHGLLLKLGGGTTNFLRADGTWAAPTGTGDVTGPGSSTDNAIVRFHLTTGKIIQDYTSNPPTISDTGDMTVDGDATVDNLITAGDVDGRDVSVDGTKLDGIDADADVTGSNAPQSHATSHQNAGGDEISVVGLSGLLADDQHVLDTEVQAIKLDDFATPDDSTDLDASLTEHGLLLKLGGGTTNFLRADGTWAAPAGGGVDTSGTPVANDIARFTDADTIEGLSYSEFKTALDLEIGTDFQAWDTDLDDISALADTDGNFIVGNGASWVAESGATVRASLALTIGTHVQTWDDDLDDIAALTPTDSNIIVGDGTDWVTETGATARTSIGLGTGDTPQFTGVEVGAASDTTLARLEAGVLSVEGSGLLRAPTGTDWENRTYTGWEIVTTFTTYTIGSGQDFETLASAASALQGLILVSSVTLSIQENLTLSTGVTFQGMISAGGQLIFDLETNTISIDDMTENTGITIIGQVEAIFQDGTIAMIATSLNPPYYMISANSGCLLNLNACTLDFNSKTFAAGVRLYKSQGRFYNVTWTDDGSANGVYATETSHGGFTNTDPTSILADRGSILVETTGNIIPEQ